MPTIPLDPMFGLQLHLQNLNAGQYDLNVVNVWDDYTGEGIQVAVIDDGIDLGHADLDGNLLTDIDFGYFGGGGFTPFAGRHGTAVAGIIGAEEGNGYGGVGVAWNVDLVSFNGYREAAVLDAAGLGDGVGNTNGNDNGSDVINASYGISGNFSGFGDELAFPRIADHGRGGLGTNFVHANGNEREGSGGTGRESVTEEMATDQISISVNALRFDGWVSFYSTPGSNSLISAFADDLDNSGGIVTTDQTGAAGYAAGDFTDAFNGTSAATPEVAGVVALILEANPDLGWRDIQSILAYSARHVGSAVDSAANSDQPTTGGINRGYEIATQANGSTWFWNDALDWNGGSMHFSNDYGFGLVDALAAVRLAETWDIQSTSHNQLSYSIDIDGAGPTTVDSTTLTFAAQLPEDILIENVSLNLDFSVDDVNDLSIFLVSPDGTRIQLIHYLDGPQGTNAYTTGAAGWDFGVTGFMGTLNEGASDPVNTGDWTLEVTNIDGAAAGAFTITDADLTFKGRPVEFGSRFIFTNEYSDYVTGPEHSATIFNGSINAAAVSSNTTLGLDSDTGEIDGVAISAVAIREVFTGDGNDTITADGVTQLILTGRGDDSINAGFNTNGLTINGGRGDDSILGGVGNDIVIDGIRTDSEGVDTIDGYFGDDLFVVNWVTDGSYDGGADIDTLDVRGDNSRFSGDNTLDLSGPTFNSFGATFTNFENLIAGVRDDALIGSSVANILIAGRGNDTVTGGGGADTILGDDTPFGLLALNKDGVTDQAAEVTGFAEMPTENLTVEWLFRGTAAEAEANMSFFSYAVSGSTNEFLVYASTTGTITVWVNDGSSFDTGVSTSAVLDGDVHRMSVSLNTGAGPNGRISLYIDGAEVFRGPGTSSDTGSPITAGGTIEIGQDQDGSVPGGGFDPVQRLVGEIGDIRIWSTELDPDVISDLAFKRLETLDLRDHPSLVANWQLDSETQSFSNIAGTAAMAPVSAASNPFQTDRYTHDPGNDSLAGDAGDDSIEGGGGSDILSGGGDNDTLDGGAGADLADFSGSAQGVDVDLGAGTATGEGSDTLISVENARGSAQQDRIVGANFVDNTLDGAGGNDTLSGRGGNDGLFGGGGDDLLLADSGEDEMNGGANTDTVSFQYVNAAASVNLQAGTASSALTGNDVLSSIENVIGSGEGDLIYGASLTDNRIDGGGGADRLYGLNGNDTLIGGSGNDHAAGGGDNDSVTGDAGEDTLYGNDGQDTLEGGADNDTLDGGANNDTLIGGSGEDRLEGGTGADSLSGGSFADRINGGLGDDTIDGGGNYDTVLYTGLAAAVQVNLEAGTATGGGGTDTLSNVEFLFGSGHADTLYGTQFHGNRLEGSNGNDTIYGLDGRDTILGGNNDDRLYGGSDVDRLLGGDGNDYLDGGANTDFLTGGSGADNFVFRAIGDTGVGRYSRDEIRDFDAAEGDVVNLYLMDANANAAGNQAFSYVGAFFTGGAGEIILNDYVLSGVDVTIASLDVDGDRLADGQVYVVGGAVIADFVL